VSDTDILSRIVSELSQLIAQIFDTLRLSHPLGNLGVITMFIFRLIGKCVVDFLLVFTDFFRYVLRLRRYGRK